MTSVVIAGTLRDAFGVALTNYDIQLVSLRTSETVLNTTTVKTTTSATGARFFILKMLELWLVKPSPLASMLVRIPLGVLPLSWFRTSVRADLRKFLILAHRRSR